MAANQAPHNRLGAQCWDPGSSGARARAPRRRRRLAHQRRQLPWRVSAHPTKMDTTPPHTTGGPQPHPTQRLWPCRAAVRRDLPRPRHRCVWDGDFRCLHRGAPHPQPPSVSRRRWQCRRPQGKPARRPQPAAGALAFFLRALNRAPLVPMPLSATSLVNSTAEIARAQEFSAACSAHTPSPARLFGVGRQVAKQARHPAPRAPSPHAAPSRACWTSPCRARSRSSHSPSARLPAPRRFAASGGPASSRERPSQRGERGRASAAKGRHDTPPLGTCAFCVPAVVPLARGLYCQPVRLRAGNPSFWTRRQRPRPPQHSSATIQHPSAPRRPCLAGTASSTHSPRACAPPGA
jgi:hypothetical protein